VILNIPNLKLTFN